MTNLITPIFTDDLVLFLKANINHGLLLRNIIDQFCSFSRHHVHTRKANMFFSRGVQDNLNDRISRLLGFQKVQDLDKYIGIPLFHKRITNSIVQFVVENVRSKLCIWDAEQLSVVGRFTLI